MTRRVERGSWQMQLPVSRRCSQRTGPRLTLNQQIEHRNPPWSGSYWAREHGACPKQARCCRAWVPLGPRARAPGAGAADASGQACSPPQPEGPSLAAPACPGPHGPICTPLSRNGKRHRSRARGAGPPPSNLGNSSWHVEFQCHCKGRLPVEVLACKPCHCKDRSAEPRLWL